MHCSSAKIFAVSFHRTNQIKCKRDWQWRLISSAGRAAALRYPPIFHIVNLWILSQVFGTAAPELVLWLECVLNRLSIVWLCISAGNTEISICRFCSSLKYANAGSFEKVLDSRGLKLRWMISLCQVKAASSAVRDDVALRMFPHSPFISRTNIFVNLDSRRLYGIDMMVGSPM